MATKAFGTHQEGAESPVVDHLAEMQKLVGTSVPIAVQVSSAGELIGASYETEWQEGGTKPVKNKKGEVTSYKENYKTKKITKEQAKKLDDYISENIAE